MIYLAALIFTALVAAGLAWFLCEALASALDVEDGA